MVEALFVLSLIIAFVTFMVITYANFRGGAAKCSVNVYLLLSVVLNLI